MEDIKAVKANADIVAVIGEYVGLKKQGKEYRACCPFHDEKTPSFTVMPDRQRYHCFGCGADGDVVDFVSKHLGVTVPEALKMLSGKGSGDHKPMPKRPSQRVEVDHYADYLPANSDLEIRAGEQIKLYNPKTSKFFTVSPTMVFDYRPVGWWLRTEDQHGKKIFFLARWCKGPEGFEGWTVHKWPTPHPIFGRLDDGKQVLVVEGSKTVQAGARVAGDRLSVIGWDGGKSLRNCDWSVLQGRRVILLPDNDEGGRESMAWLYGHLLGIAESVRMVSPPDTLPKGWDIADKEWSSAQELFEFCRDNMMSGEQLKAAEPVTEYDPRPEPPPVDEPERAPLIEVTTGQDISGSAWRAELMFKNDGESLVHNIHNGIVMLSQHPKIKGVFALNRFDDSIYLQKEPPWFSNTTNYPQKLTDYDEIKATAWLERMGVKLQVNTVHNCIVAVAEEKSHDPLNNYLNSLEWDGKPRIEKFLNNHLGVDDSDYSRAVSKRFLISAAARALRAGCKVDTVLILEGEQGAFKSTAISVLCGEDWFTDELADIGSKDCSLQLQGKWIIELSELTGLNKSTQDRIKEWIPRRVDRYRPSYGRNLVEKPRRCVLVGTVNPQGGYLKDSTGARRFWPVKVNKVDLESIRRDRDQLWAEAVDLFKAGEQWHLTKDEEVLAREEQADRHESDAWEETVSGFIHGKNFVSIDEIMNVCLEIPKSQQNQLVQKRIIGILSKYGYEKSRPRIDGVRKWLYCLKK